VNRSFLKQLKHILIEPYPAYDVATHHKSRLLSAFLLVMIFIFASLDAAYVMTVPGYAVPWYGYVFLLTAYALNRLPYFKISAGLVIIMFPVVIFSTILSGDSNVPAVSLGFLVLGLIVGSILFSQTGIIILATINISGVLILPYLVPQTFPDFSSIISPLAILVIGTALLVISMRHRDQIEIARQAELRDSDDRLRLALEAARIGTWNWDIETGTVQWSPEIEPIFGMQKGGFGGKYQSYLSLIHPDDLKSVQDAIDRALSGEKNYLVEHRLLWQNGEMHWIEGRGEVYRDGMGKPVRMTGTVVDITDRKLAEESLRTAEERYRGIVENAFDGIFQSTPDGRFISVNQRMADIYGYESPEKMVSEINNIAQELFVNPGDREIFKTTLERDGAVRNYELNEYKKDGSLIWTSMNARVVRDATGRSLYYDGVIEDISARKRAEAEREALINELESKNAELEQFTYTVSHDLKAPIITIKGFLGFLAEDALAGNVKRLEVDIRRISEAADKMYNLLNDLLELSRIGRVMNDPELVDIHELVFDAEKILQSHLHKYDVKLLVNGQLPLVHGDRQRLLEVVQNLLDNAIKFLGDQKHPTIEIGQYDQAKDGFATFYIRDNGIGIAPEYHERIFGLFNRLDPMVDGTGVGLALVKRIIEFHGGRIWVESETGMGATFFFTLPQLEK